MAERLAIPLLGLNFVPSSNAFFLHHWRKNGDTSLKKMRFVGVFQNQSPNEVLAICQQYFLDFAQLSGMNPQKIFTIFPFLFSKEFLWEKIFRFQKKWLNGKTRRSYSF